MPPAGHFRPEPSPAFVSFGRRGLAGPSPNPTDKAHMNPRYRHTDFSGITRIYKEAEAAGYAEDAVRRLLVQYPRELAKVRRECRLRPVPVSGNRALGRRMGYFETLLSDGTLGYFQRRTDDCAQAAIATLIQMSIDQVPDTQLDKQLLEGKDSDRIIETVARQYAEWTEKYELTILKYETPPVEATRWIGVVTSGGSEFNDHCLVMSGQDVLWDATRLLPAGKYEPILTWGRDRNLTVEDIDYGIIIGRKLSE